VWNFRILGPLDVRRAGVAVRIGAAKHRALLACLLLRANRAVPIDELIDWLWDDAPPSDARGAVHSYVNRLRRSLGASDANPIVTGPGSYLITAATGELDLLRLRELDAATRKAARSGDLAAESEALDAALELWTGIPLSDVKSRRLHTTELPALIEQRLQLLERRAEVRLRLGRSADLASELATLTNEHPLRERFWALRMRALYHTGRQADALQIYQTVAQLLVTELGIDPCAELRALHAEVLAGTVADPAAAPVPTGQLCAPDVPRQLPPDIASFTGRADELRQLDQLLASASEQCRGKVMISAINGLGGIGKSALALHAAHRLAERFPDGQLYADLRGANSRLAPVKPMDVLGPFLRSLSIAADQVPHDLEEATARYRSLLAGRRLLIVLDNARNAGQIRPLLPGSPSCGVLVTSRAVLADVDGACHLRLDVLPSDEAVTLLTHLVGAERVGPDRAAAAEIARLCGNLPLALRIAGARLAARPGWPLRELVKRLADTRHRLSELRFGELDARASIQLSYDTLLTNDDGEAARAFRLLGLSDSPEISTAVAARLLDRTAVTAERSLEQLVDAQLLTSSIPGRYQMHDLLRLFARELATREPAPARPAALEHV